MHDLRDAAGQAWPPFVLVAGLLMVGAVAHADGLFERAGAFVGRLPGPRGAVLFWCMLLVAVVTATMNLDTAVVFLTPVLILVARRRSLDERPFLYAALFMANASSLFLPGANLTNLLVLGREPIGGGAFAAALIAPALTAAVVTGVGIRLWFRSTTLDVDDQPRAAEPEQPSPSADGQPTPAAAGNTGLVGVLVAACLTIGLHEPALPVLATGLATAAFGSVRGAITPRAVVRAIGPAVLLGLFGLSVALGVLARSWDGPSHLLAEAGRWETVGIAALTSVAVNNLPAAVLLSAHHVDHARALLIGLNLGPNLAVTGSLSSYLWYRAAKQVGAQPSALQVSRIGVVLTPIAIAAATLSLSLGGSLLLSRASASVTIYSIMRITSRWRAKQVLLGAAIAQMAGRAHPGQECPLRIVADCGA